MTDHHTRYYYVFLYKFLPKPIPVPFHVEWSLLDSFLPPLSSVFCAYNHKRTWHKLSPKLLCDDHAIGSHSSLHAFLSILSFYLSYDSSYFGRNIRGSTAASKFTHNRYHFSSLLHTLDCADLYPKNRGSTRDE